MHICILQAAECLPLPQVHELTLYPCTMPLNRLTYALSRHDAWGQNFALIFAAVHVQFSDCVVSVARKTDAALWPSLFAAVGAASVLAEGLLSAGALHRAACALLIVDRLQGSELAHALALRLMQVLNASLVSRKMGWQARLRVYVCRALICQGHMQRHA